MFLCTNVVVVVVLVVVVKYITREQDMLRLHGRISLKQKCVSYQRNQCFLIAEINLLAINNVLIL